MRVSGEIGLRVAPVLHDDLIALAFGFTYNGALTQADTILLDGQTLAARLPTNDSRNALLLLVTPRIVKIGEQGTPTVEPRVSNTQQIK